jgi:deoxyribonuclease-4
MPLFGAHMSISGGLSLAFERLAEVGGAALQIFTANQRQWQPKLPEAQEIGTFRARRAAAGTMPVAAHDSYLINLASPKPEVAEKSRTAFAEELRRCAALGVEYVVMHPGSHLGEGSAAGLRSFTDNLDQAIDRSGTRGEVMVLLETTAGQGTSLGADFSELAAIIKGSAFAVRLGVCLDTCHVFAAGYELRTPAGYRQTMAEFERVIGLERLKMFHLNDSKKELGSRVDRHELLGQGQIGLAGFRLLINDPRFVDHPMILETPKSEDMHEDKESLQLLRSLLAC